MGDVVALRQQVADLLQQQEQTLISLAALLDSETGSLKERLPAEMEKLAGDKLALSREVEVLGQRLTTLLGSQGLVANAENFKQFMQQLELSEAWQRSISLLTECQQHNAINGGIISATRANTDKILDILHGQTGSPRLYGASGKYDQTSGISPIAKA